MSVSLNLPKRNDVTVGMWYRRTRANPHHLPTTTVIARPKAVAISCEIVQILTMYQEIATSLRSSQ